MRGDLLLAGFLMQLINLVALSVIFIQWNLNFVLTVIFYSLYALFNIASIIFIVVGLFGNQNKNE